MVTVEPQMQRAVFRVDSGKFEIESVPVPAALEADEALLESRYVGLCGSDLRMTGGDWPETPTTTMGHEVAAVVVDGPPGWAGKRVVVEPTMRCERCWQCQHGLGSQCTNAISVSGTQDGAFANYFKFKVRQLVVVPDALPLDCAVLAEPLACVIDALRKAPQPIAAKRRFLVLGGGPIGCLFAYMLERFHGVPVEVAETNAYRREYLAARLDGRVFDPAEGIEADSYGAAIDTTGFLWDTAVRAVIPSGVILSFGMTERGGPSAQNMLTRKEITGIGVAHSRYGALEDAVDMLARGIIKRDDQVTSVFALADINAAFDEARAGRGMKVVIQPNPDKETEKATRRSP